MIVHCNGKGLTDSDEVDEEEDLGGYVAELV